MGRGRLVDRLRSPSLAAIAVTVLLAVLVALGGLALERRHDRAVNELSRHWNPAQDTVSRLDDAIADARAACLVGPPGQALAEEAHYRLVVHLPDLRRQVAISATVTAAVTEFDRIAADWFAAGSPSTVGTYSGHCEPALTDEPPAQAPQYPEVHGRLSVVGTLLRGEVERAQHEVAQSGTAILWYVLALCVAVLVATAVGARLIDRRVLMPLGTISEQLRLADDRRAEDRHVDPGVAEAGLYALPVPASARPPGPVARLAQEADGVRARLRHSQRQARRGEEALLQNGPCVRGVHRALTVRGRPGPGVAAASEVAAADGLIAGDYLGVLALPGGATAVFLGDVSGHGVESGLLAVRLKSVVDSALRAGLGPAAAVLGAWHSLEHEYGPEPGREPGSEPGPEQERFTTLVVAVLDPAGGLLHWVNAGHEEPFLLRAGGAVERLAPCGPLVHPVLAPDPDDWRPRSTPFSPGDLLVLCTDGLTEGRGGLDDFGEHRVTEVLAALAGRTPAEAVHALLAAVDEFGIDWDRDDVSVLAATLLPAAG
ncbi:PP2C family protein-serine/threonine phosphatase [Streptomyces sp. TLI_171]|uniref:PP2C family protein-serine/threonine phosphatase n=1 Tax=Streptomyces sp. TLI_171 TaxID=1938859 RepID=UPI000C18B57A|nr:PP2C family protein-serine/threonine phosphatase [Streptomyces sp. TLI_171]RKE22979.1 stage II sporulation protein E [Streptomyces sp. TLI_171]